ncbi:MULTISPECIES: hypothetical protein [unclassified Bacillus (in: firmicutes)]|uniref:hypothetical protein n=1 Tax=unclassified Bacillus (in: firmicutes) TaxID=185979 RepID=UPI0008E7D3F8|nr:MULTISPECIES: hypothetical protein [unclassified Bacillus (in: firmicutes)]SFA71491.1 hypothetical protein SAMN02799634_101215 [Bacillus sp. UNCCL13]SFQ61698.1 hypothetical protein SAMN04488577_0496 [Bacillus sp. cl95]
MMRVIEIGDILKTWVLRLKENKILRNMILLGLLIVLYCLPQDWSYLELIYVMILFLIAFISTYIEKESISKGLFLSLYVTSIIVIVSLATVSLFPAISSINLIVVMGFTGFLCTYLIG